MNPKNPWWQGWRNEPLRIVNLVQVAVALAVAFGLDLTDQQQTLILSLAALLVAGGELGRSQVTPMNKVRKGERR